MSLGTVMSEAPQEIRSEEEKEVTYGRETRLIKFVTGVDNLDIFHVSAPMNPAIRPHLKSHVTNVAKKVICPETVQMSPKNIKMLLNASNAEKMAILQEIVPIKTRELKETAIDVAALIEMTDAVVLIEVVEEAVEAEMKKGEVSNQGTLLVSSAVRRVIWPEIAQMRTLDR